MALCVPCVAGPLLGTGSIIAFFKNKYVILISLFLITIFYLDYKKRCKKCNKK